ncbi:uncharacterized protein LOC131876573 [Cryptomeria japonica]|uniref:uncharacterized protein LOC131876573 n=1 Tax=Cryptomeria japonica TaxID=3369 RepID=UPI0027DA7BA6|nr:uncharacterized protein LOC131876573 [Cryptomeria japonica]
MGGGGGWAPAGVGQWAVTTGWSGGQARSSRRSGGVAAGLRQPGATGRPVNWLCQVNPSGDNQKKEGWSKLDEGWIKINFDGASQGNPGLSGIGFVAQDWSGNILAFGEKLIVDGINNVVEAMATYMEILGWWPGGGVVADQKKGSGGPLGQRFVGGGRGAERRVAETDSGGQGGGRMVDDGGHREPEAQGAVGGEAKGCSTERSRGGSTRGLVPESGGSERAGGTGLEVGATFVGQSY